MVSQAGGDVYVLLRLRPQRLPMLNGEHCECDDKRAIAWLAS